MKTEQLEEKHFEEFVRLAHTMQRECEPDIPLDEHELLTNMYSCINDPNREYINAWLAYDDDKLVGMGVATCSKYLFSTYKGSLMHFWYVSPDYRQSSAGIHILKEFLKWSKKLHAHRAHFGADRVHSDVTNINEALHKCGFTKFGEQFYKRLDNNGR